MNISLATFKEDKKKGADSENGTSEVLRLIELSVLQQLFYHEKDEKIPDSRFKKIKSYKTRYLWYYTIGFISFLISVLFLVAPKVLAKFSLIEIPYEYFKLTHLLASLISIVGLFIILLKSSRAIKGMAIKKLKIKDAEIEIDSKISKSILNNHIDEILYFFEVTDYNVVFIEDLDRFEQTEVFTKLREINLLINNSKKIKGEVVFIYAIKDDMFVDKDRTKFFDFMIPIIPVINYSNSNEKLLSIVKKNGYSISEDLMDNLALFIDDMRLLYNIMNEYNIYSNKLDGNLNQDKLLSMIVYKNLHPKDFNELNQNEGFLYNIILKKTEYIKDELRKLDQKISELNNRIKEVELVQLRDLPELRLIYISKIIEKINTTRYGLVSFNLDNESYTITKAAEDKPFEILMRGGQIQYYYQYNNSNHAQINFPNIEKEVCPNLSYKEREKLVLDKSQVNNLKRKISDLESSKNEVRKYKLNELIKDKQLDINDAIEETPVELKGNIDKQKELINILLRNAYIDENYLDYISIFHEGSLTKADNQFLINVRIQKETEFDFKLTKCQRLIEKINLFEFEKKYVLNFDLIDALQKQVNQDEKKKRVFIQLSSQTSRSIEFIDKFIDVTTDIELFVKTLCPYWLNIWIYIADESIYEDDKKERYLKLILKYASIEDIIQIFEDHIAYLNIRCDFLTIIDDQEKLKEIIKNLNLKFIDISFDSPASLVEYVYNGNYYAITEDTLDVILQHHNKFDKSEFENSNYSIILNSNLTTLIDYVKSNLPVYVENVYLQFKSNIDEPVESYLKLLNAEDLELSTMKNIIIQVNTKVIDLNLVSNPEVWNLLLENSKVEPNWENVLLSFNKEEDSINESLIEFLNDDSNSKVLSSYKIPLEMINEDVYTYEKLTLSLINCQAINDGTYDRLIESIPWAYKRISLSNLTRERVCLLINGGVLDSTVENFEALKEDHNGLNINLLERFSSKYIEQIEELIFDSDDMLQILKSSSISSLTKNVFIEHCSKDTITSNSDIIKLLSQMLLSDVSIKVNKSILNAILLDEDISTVDRVNLFIKNLVFEDVVSLDSFIETLDEEYADIANRNIKAVLDDTELNELFLSKLDMLDYISSVSKTSRGLRVNHKRK